MLLSESKESQKNELPTASTKHIRWMEKLQSSIDNGRLLAKDSKRGTNKKLRNDPTQITKIGLDFGGVIVGEENDGHQVNSSEDTMFGINYLRSKEVQGAAHAVHSIICAFGASNVFIISKARKEMRRKTLEWLDHNEFYDRTGLWHCNVLFCREREQKGPIAKKLSLDLFIDDNKSCLTCMPDSVFLRLLFGPKNSSATLLPFNIETHPNPDILVCVNNWEAILIFLGLNSAC